jgi:hypothetical protein
MRAIVIDGRLDFEVEGIIMAFKQAHDVRSLTYHFCICQVVSTTPSDYLQTHRYVYLQ